MKLFALCLPAPALAGLILLMSTTNKLPPADEPVVNPHITFNPDPPKFGENLEIHIEWGFFTGDKAEITLDFDPVGSDVTITIPRGEKGVVGLPKGAQSVTAKDKSKQCDDKSAEIDN